MVTIAIPTFNRKHIWKRGLLIESITRQTNADFEVLICDDGSTDGSIEYFKRVFPTIRRFRITKEDRPAMRASGLADNILIKEAKGDIFLHIDDDCWLDPHTVAYAKEHGKDKVIWGQTVCVNEQGETIFTDNRRGLILWSGLHLFPLHPILNAAHGALWIAPTQTLRDIGGLDFATCENRGQDSFLGNRLSRHIPSYYTDEITCYHAGLSTVKAFIDEIDKITDEEEKQSKLQEIHKIVPVMPKGNESIICNGGSNWFENDFLKKFYEQIL